MTEPTDAEIMLEASKVGGLFDDLAIGYQSEDILKFARAVLARRGRPSGAGEPVAPDFYTACAWYEGGGESGWIALPGYSNETEHGVKHLILEAARKEGYKGTITGRLMELGWEIRPVYLAPQPTQTVPPAGREPLTEEQRSDIATAAAGFNWNDDYVEAIDYVIDGVESLHDIKGKEAGNAE